MPVGLRVRAAAAQSIAFASVLFVSTSLRAKMEAGAWYPLKSAASFAVIAAIVVARISRDSHPFRGFGPANAVTTVRAVFVALVVGTMGEPSSSLLAMAAVIGLCATIMDAVDGQLARRSGMASRFGARFDMEVDALLILALAILVWQHGKAGAWVVVSGLLRYGFLVAGWMVPKMRRPLPDSRRRQTICVIQIAGLLIALAPPITPPASSLVAGAALAALAYSFAVDTIWLVRTPAFGEGRSRTLHG